MHVYLGSPAPPPDRFAALFFAGLFVTVLGLAMLLAYEAWVLWTQGAPTISQLTAYSFLRHPRWWVAGACLAFFSLGALVTHFTHWTPW